MNQTLSRRIAKVVLALALPIAALANVNETTILQTNMALSLDTGAVSTSGGDILWNGATFAPQGSAKLRTLNHSGITDFGLLTQAYCVSVAAGAKATPLAANLLGPGYAFVAVTNGGKVAKVLIIANSGGTITLQFTTFGATAPAGVPLVAQLLNNSSYIPMGFPSYGIAPSSVFTIFGSGLSDPGVPVPQASAPPGLPLSLNGTSVTVVVNGVTTHPALYYTSPGQLAAVLPAATPVGTGILTVIYRGITSAPVPIHVIAAALGIDMYGLALGVATDTSGSLFTYANSASPGQTIVLWATGLGADPADSDTTYTTSPHSVHTPLQIYFGAVPATILYQGASGYPGVNQIDLVIPESAPTGCWVPMAAVAGGVLSNVVTISINNGGGACIDAATALTGNQIAPPNGQALKAGLVSLVQTHSPAKGGTVTVTGSANAAFEQYTGLYPSRNSVSPGGCIVTLGLTPVPLPNIVGLDTGAITLGGPAGLSVTLKSQGFKGAFYDILPAGAIPETGGTFTFKSAGGTDVGPFTSIMVLTNPIFTWTNEAAAAAIDRGRGLQVTWTGGNPGSYVFITGTSTSTSLGAFAGFTCLSKVDDGQFTVPSFILSGLPAGKGGVVVQNDVYWKLSASGIDIGLALGDISYSTASTLQ